MELNEIMGVGAVRTTKNGHSVLIEVELIKFDQATRWTVYGAEDELQSKYPEYELEFRVIDSSWNGTLENARVS